MGHRSVETWHWIVIGVTWALLSCVLAGLLGRMIACSELLDARRRGAHSTPSSPSSTSTSLSTPTLGGQHPVLLTSESAGATSGQAAR